MLLELKRFLSDKDSTIGIITIEDKFVVWSCEDEHREVKFMHETRIPEGHYLIDLRKEGGHHDRYSKDKDFKSFHKGMLELQDVPGFKHILIHVGNTEKDTSGCILVGTTVNPSNLTIGNSRIGYSILYNKVIKSIESGETVVIKITDHDRDI